MVSIVIPVYNVRNVIAQCLDSILAQTYDDFEVILVDDGSNDGSGMICEEYAYKDNRFIAIHTKNSGVSAARNKGIDKAKGEWITFVDSDDFLESDYLECFHLERNDADMIIQGLEFYNDRSGEYFKQVRVKGGVLEQNVLKQSVEDNALLHSGYPVAKAYRSDIIKSGFRFDTALSYHEDHVFVLSVLSVVGKIRLENSVSYKYRVYHNDNSLSSRRHSWQALSRASDGMIAALNNLRDKYLVRDSIYERKIYNFAYSPKISAVFEIFKLPVSSDLKKETLNIVITRKELRTYYKPFLLKDKVVKYILSIAPFVVKRMFFLLYIRYQNYL